MIARTFFALGFASLAAAAFVACDGSESNSGVDEPIHVKSAQFIEGNLPGTAPGLGGPADLRITNVVSNNRIVIPGQAGKKFDGRASQRASAIGIRFADLGSGYWVFPLGSPDPLFPGEAAWGAEIDFSIATSAVAGYHPLRVVAIDEAGNAGEQSEVSLCTASTLPDNLNSCDATKAPPDVVVSLFWDATVDLDLRVVLPGGRAVDPKHPLTDPNADGGAANPDIGVITRDSVAACVEDGRRQEDLVWQKRPQGVIDLYAHLFNACGRTSTTFSMVVYEAEGEVPNRRLVERSRQNGRIVSTPQGNESDLPATYVSSYTF